MPNLFRSSRCRHSALLFLFCLIQLAVLFPSPVEGRSFSVPAGAVRARVVDVVDGDTIYVQVAGERKKVRYIGIDTPELSDPRPEVAALAREAYAANRDLVAGKVVWLEPGAEAVDEYGRDLAYVYLKPDILVNARLVEEGVAQVFTVPPNVRYEDDFAALQREAWSEGRTFWAKRAMWEWIEHPRVRRRSVAAAVSSPKASAPSTYRGRVVVVRVGLVKEYVVVANRGERRVDLAGWRLRSFRGNQVFTFPEGSSLDPGSAFIVWSGRPAAPQGDEHLYWTDSYVWNNDGDRAELIDATGLLVDAYP